MTAPRPTPDQISAVVAALQSQRHEDAAALAGALLARHPAAPEAQHLAGVVALQRGQAAEAVARLIQAVELHPSYAQAHANLALAYNANGRAADAVAAMERAIALGSRRPADYQNLAALSLSHAPARAAWALRHLIALQPDGAELWRQLAQACLQAGTPDLAASAARRTALLEPNQDGRWRELALVLQRAGRPEAAVEAAERAHRLAPGQPANEETLATLLFDAGRRDEAEPLLLKAAEAGCGNGFVFDQLGEIGVTKGPDEQRRYLTLLEKVVVDGTGRRDAALTALASILAAQGRQDQALAWLGRMRTVWSRHFTLKTLLTLERQAAEAGQPLPPLRRAEVERPGLSATSLARYGRFAHVLSEYLALRLYCETHGLRLEAPDWIGRAVFELDDPAPSRPRSIRHGKAPEVAAALRAGTPSLAESDIWSPGFFCGRAERARFSRWLTPRPVWRPRLEAPLERVRAMGRTVVGLHLRRTDLEHLNANTLDIHRQWLEANWTGLDQPVLYVASDDPAGVRAALEPFRPVLLDDVADPWPDMEFLQDFHVLRHAEVVMLSQGSSFGWVAAMLNERNSRVLRTTPGGMAPFDLTR